MFVNKKENKKGISILVSYVLLITLAIALAAATYTFLRTYAEKPLPEEGCPEGTNIVIENYTCEDDGINITIKNRGLFNVTGVFIKIGNETDSEFLYDFLEISPDCTGKPRCVICDRDPCFAPNEEFYPESPFSYSSFNKITRIVVIPYRAGEPYATLCKNAIASLDIPEGACE